jgi:hypothetical protein
MRKGTKNVFNQALGLVLKDLRRDARGMDSTKVANRLNNLDESRYRLIESGSAVLQAHRALALSSIFPDRIRFSRITDVLAGIDTLEQAKHGENELPKQMATLQALETAVPGLKPVLQGLKSILEKPELRSNAIGALRDLGVVQDLKLYLCTPESENSGTVSSHPVSRLQERLLQVSPLEFERLVQQLDSDKEFPRRPTMDGIQQWERQGAMKFARIYGVVDDLALLRSEVTEYSWDYVYLEDFEGMFIITRKDTRTSETYQKTLRTLLVKNRSSGKSESATSKLRNLVTANLHVVSHESPSLDALMEFDLPQGILKKGGGLHLHNAWLYVMRDTHNTVAFVDSKIRTTFTTSGAPMQNVNYHAAVLSWADTQTLLRTIETMVAPLLGVKKLKPLALATEPEGAA